MCVGDKVYWKTHSGFSRQRTYFGAVRVRFGQKSDLGKGEGVRFWFVLGLIRGLDKFYLVFSGAL